MQLSCEINTHLLHRLAEHDLVMTNQQAGEHRSHDLCSPSATNSAMENACFDSKVTDQITAGGEAEAPPVVWPHGPVGCHWRRDFTYEAAFANRILLYPG